MTVTPAQIIRPEIRALSAYHVPPSEGMVKLDAMENPYGLPADMRAEIARLAGESAVNRYPDPTATALKRRLAQVMNVPDSLELLLGNGSDEIIQMLALAVARPDAVVLGVEPSFVMFRMIATIAGLRYVGVPLTPDFQLNVDRILDAIEEHRPALAFIAYPNNPTGNLFDADDIVRIVQACPGLMVVDEAYHAFAGKSFLPRAQEYPNLVVMRTLSKLGLAGLRLGMLIGASAWLSELEKLRLPYNVNALTQRIAEYALSRTDVLDEQARAICAERSRLIGRLDALPGVQPFASDANFVLFRVKGAGEVFEALKARRVLIKNVSAAHPMLHDCLRVTVGTPEENECFVSALAAGVQVAA